MITKDCCHHDFVAIDIEYADSIQHICQFGLVVVRELKIVDRRSWFIRPPGNRYEQKMVQIHHITPDITADEPSFEQIWPEIWEYLKGECLWAHNAQSVELPVINKNIRFCEQDFETIQWINDSRNLFKRPGFPPDSGNGLAQCCMALGIPCENHHDALADAEMCAQLVIAAIEERKPVWEKVPISDEEVRKAQQGKRILRLGEFREYYDDTSSGEEDVFCELASTCAGATPQVIDVFDMGDKFLDWEDTAVDFSRLNTSPENPIYGRKVVVTGMFNIKRKELEKAIDAMGAKRIPMPTRNASAVILGTRNVGFKKLIAIEEQQAAGHDMALIVGNDDLHELLYGNGNKFFGEQKKP